MQHRIFFGSKIPILFLLIFLCSTKLIAQSYDFSNFSLKEGLIQSQVLTIYQAKDRTLWLGTQGGLSNYDGKEFTPYSKADGLISNTITSIVQDNQGQIIVGSEGGINIIKNGNVRTILSGYSIYMLKKDRQGIIWGITAKKLFKLVNEKIVFVNINDEDIINISENRSGDLFIVANGNGIYRQTKRSWAFAIEFPEQIAKSLIVEIIFDRYDPKKMYLVTLNDGVFSYDGSHFKIFYNQKKTQYRSIEQDDKGNIWIGIENGVVLVRKNDVVYFNSTNGLSDNAVHALFKDAENNIWISSFANGIFKYEGDAFVRYNKFKDLKLDYVVSGLGADKNNNLFIGTFDRGLLRYDGQNVEILKNPAFAGKDIYFLYVDQEKNIWFSVQGSGVWKTDGKNFKLIYKIIKLDYSAMHHGYDNDIWLITPLTLVHIKGNQREEISGFGGFASSLYVLSKDSILVGTTTGLFLIRNKRLDRKFVIAPLKSTYVLSIVKRNGSLIFGTLGDGMVTWDLKTNATKKYTSAQGLNSNDVYSLGFDDHNNLWVGTGRGVNTFSYNRQKNQYQVFKTSSPIIECNQNVILNYKGNMLLGTINGLVQCKPNVIEETAQRPLIHINKINIFHKSDKNKDRSILLPNNSDKDIILTHNQNNISINYKAVFLSNPQNVSYRYKLSGLDTHYGKSIKNTQVEYYALRPGKYSFFVYAIGNGQISNISQFNFTIVPPFYEKVWFRIGVFLLSIFIVWLIFYLFFKSKESKKQELEKIKQTEQNKIRKQTSEDFHDDIGNKLTRINVLSEILDKKLDKEQTEQKELIRLIQENAALLYNGTKDILWALNPKSDNLFEILVHIRNFGIDLFQNTGIKFEMDGVSSEFQTLNLSMEFNRNFTLIFKEILNNVLKHAQAKEVLIMVIKTPQNTIDILTVDNGVGFDVDATAKGCGLANIQTRCKRIKSTFKISSSEGKGTTSIISTRITVTN